MKLIVIFCLLLPLVFGGDPRKCSGFPATREGLIAAAFKVVSSGKIINYTQDPRRWSGINNGICPEDDVPPYADCSSFITWLYWSLFGYYPDYLNRADWAGGYTGRLADNGMPVSLNDAQPGDVVLYGNRRYSHAAIYVGGNRVISYGSTGPAKLLNIGFLPNKNYDLRTYPDFFAVGAPCNGVPGTCIDTDSTTCSKPLIAGRCRGPNFVKCCPE
ncbi:6987_t:CDS:1 [Paraglomus brasilianum]|uniref:6987_t:CDS:1 n=1 Tax=Paraglomus brasilianum TaxID=144538 RepID=A0A9N9A6T6_9GLOM|nr:6987_t:CDS:1 [Paraglomus brasilianum]